jgi:hypothetical protein
LALACISPATGLSGAFSREESVEYMRSWTVLLLALTLAEGCGRVDETGDEHEPQDPEPAAVRAPLPPPPAPPMSASDSAQALARIAAERDSVLAVFDMVRVLRAREVAELRQDRNAEQIAIARRLGVQPANAAQIERLRRQGRLVALQDSTPYWVLREMEHSIPYVTPDAQAMLVQLGRRFHARLDSLGLPRYRMKVTSALRTDESQAALRRTNANASRIVSAHEFGTTIDVSHERFAVPAETPAPAPPGREMEVEMLEEVGKEHARALQAELGRAIQDLRKHGALKVMMEDRQPVYHMTVAKAYGPSPS